MEKLKDAKPKLGGAARPKSDSAVTMRQLCMHIYGLEAWTMSTADESALRVYERKILWTFYGISSIGKADDGKKDWKDYSVEDIQ